MPDGGSIVAGKRKRRAFQERPPAATEADIAERAAAKAKLEQTYRVIRIKNLHHPNPETPPFWLIDSNDKSHQQPKLLETLPVRANYQQIQPSK